MQQLLRSLGPVTAIIGAQWGDEGKGKVTDILGGHFDVIARACGGANAGHTIVVSGKKQVFHLLPAGCLHDGKTLVLGSGMAIHLPTLLQEIGTLKEAGIDVIGRLRISSAAHIVFDFHKTIDGAIEDRRPKSIGTTRRGIGPAYMDKVARTGIRMGQLSDPMEDDFLNREQVSYLRRKESRSHSLKSILTERAAAAKEVYGVTVDVAAELTEIERAKKLLSTCIVPSLPLLMQKFLEGEKTILIEGAQATLLDIDHGTYPYVTSSSTTAAGALQGLGLPPRVLTSCIGVAKAYCTRVGAGDFPTEETGPRGDRLRERGGEYGSTTGRPRRCGWLHLPDLQYSAAINGFTAINLTKLDVLDEEQEIPVGIGEENGKVIYENLPGWKTSTKGITEFQKLPKQAQTFIEFIEKRINVPVRLIGTGEGRGEIIIR